MNKRAWTAYFQQGVVANLQYWQARIQKQSTDFRALNRDGDNILKAISLALNLDEAWPLAYKLILAFSPCAERWGYWQVWSQILAQAIAAAQRSGDLANGANLSVTLALMLQRRGKLKEAVRRYRRAIQSARRAENQFAAARACTNLGYLYIELGHWYRSEVLCCHALALFEQLGSDYGCAHTENHLGWLYTHRRDWARAQSHLEQACAIWQSMGDEHGLMRGYINLGSLYSKMEQPDKAFIYYQKALSQARLTGEEAETGTILMNIAIAHRKNGELTQAEQNARQAQTIFNQVSNLVGLSQVWCTLGLIYVDRQAWSEARCYLQSSLKRAHQLGNRYVEIEALIGLVKYELARGHSSEATERLNAAVDCVQQHGLNFQYDAMLARLEASCRSLFVASINETTAE